MADKRVKYTYDDGPFCEVGITGKQTSWRKNDSAFVTEADAALLIASGRFVDGTDYGSNDVHKQAHREIGGVPRQVAVSGVPFVIPPGDGSANGLQFTGSAGAFTLSAAILAGAWNALKGCWCYLPANFGGKTYPAGWYWAVFSSDTAGILYNNTYSSGSPSRPATPTAFVDDLAGWLTQTTSEITGPTGFNLVGGSMGPNGVTKAHLRLIGNTTSNKSYKLYLGSTAIAWISPVTTSPNVEFIVSSRNQGSQSLQINSRVSGATGVGVQGGSFTGAYENTSVDTSADQNVSISLQLSTLNTACAILLGVDVTVTYGA